MAQFYQIDSTKVSLREYWWGSRSPLVIIGWILKWLRVRIPGSSDDPNTDSMLSFVAQALPPDIHALFEPLTLELWHMGYYDPVYHIIYDAGSSTTWYWATFRHTSGNGMARIHLRIWARTTKPKQILFPMFISRFADGTFLVSSAGKPDMAEPASVEMIRKRGAKLPALLEAHQQREQQLSGQKMLSPTTSRDDLISATEELHIRQRDFHIARGVFKLRAEAENARIEWAAQVRAVGYEDPDILLEIQKLQDKKTSKQTVVWVLLASVVGFLALGARQWNWKVTLWLIPILFFHEAGHWMAMRIFKYRNLRMFFIPLFGAAVVGRHWNVPGWKKALVSLAGPIPGIIVGLGLGVGSILLHNPLMNKAALMLLVLNGMNLLPVFPMDGGHVLQHTIFCRNRWLEAVFRLLAIGGLLLLGAGSKAFLSIAIALGVSLPITFKLAKVKDGLSRMDLPQPTPGEDQIPLPTAQVIVTSVKDAFSKMRLTNKAVAQHALMVFENLNAKPPGVLATLGLLAIQGGGLFVALVMCIVLIFLGKGELRDFAAAAARQPLHSVSCAAVEKFGPGVTDSAPRNLIIATFKGHQKAKQAFQEFTSQAPEKGNVHLFGESVMVSIPATDDALREKWFDLVQQRSTNLFVEVSNSSVSVTMTFLAPTKTVASNLTQELREYLQPSTSMRLVAPWSSEALQPAYAQFRTARATWLKIGDDLAAVYKEPEYTSFNSKVRAATKRGAMGEVQRLVDEQQKVMKQLRAAIIEKAGGGADTIRADLATLYAKLQDVPYTNRVERQKLNRQVAAKLGEIPYAGDKPDPQANASTASSGTVEMHGLLCELRWANFADPEGLMRFTEWLCGKGCLQIKYNLQGGWNLEDALADEFSGDE